MNLSDLREEIAIELEAMALTVNELKEINDDLDSRSPTLREKTAAAAFVAQFYNGIENILKRISIFHDVELPKGQTWHVELFQRFAAPSDPRLPELFDDKLAQDLSPYRRFRHVVFHSYGFQLEWSRMREGVANVEGLFVRFETAITKWLEEMDQDKI